MSFYENAFAKSDKTDAILVVQGNKLHVNKALLSYHSDYFNTLFNSEFKEKSMEEIPIEDVKLDDFATLLSLIHDKPLEVYKSSVENLLKLADRFLLNTPKSLIVRIVKTSSEFSRYEKLILADKYKLDDLLEYVLSMYYSKETYLDFWSENLGEFSDSVKVKLFEKIIRNCRSVFS
ncbi:unnamed protein product [Caenorhabditis brenneri]